MKIIFVLHTLTSGGAERVTCSLANYWAESGHDVAIATMGNGDDFYPLHPGVKRHRFNLSAPSSSLVESISGAFRRVRALRYLLRAERPDAAIAMMASWNIELALAGRGLPLVKIGSERIHPPTLPLSRPWEVLRKYLYRHLDFVVAQTEKSRRWIETHTRARNVRVIPNPVAMLRDAEAPEIEGLPASTPLLLGVGRLVPQKRFDRLVAALADPRVPSEWHLALVGEGPLRDALAAQAAALGVSERVHFPGRTAAIESWYRRAHAFALSSDFEGFPNALLEAMASGLPSAAMDCDTGPADLIKDGENGILVAGGDQPALADAIARLTTDPEFRMRSGAAARAVRTGYSVDRIAAQWYALCAGEPH